MSLKQGSTFCYRRYRLVKYLGLNFYSTSTHNVSYDLVQGEDVAAKRLQNARAKKKLHWENLSLFGPLIKKDDATAKRKRQVPKTCSLNWAIHEATAVQCEPKEFLDEPNTHLLDLPVCNSPILGNAKLNPDSVSFDIELPPPPPPSLSKTSLSKSSVQIDASNDYPLFVRNDRYDRAYLSKAAKRLLELQTENITDCAYVPSVTTVLTSTKSPEEESAWNKWRLNAITEHGVEAFKYFMQDLNLLETEVNNVFLRLANNISLRTIPVKSRTQPYGSSLIHAFEQLTEIEHIERNLRHPHLYYTGVMNCLATYQGKRVLVHHTMPCRFMPFGRCSSDVPVQAAAYLGALTFEIDIEHVLLVNPKADGKPASVHLMSNREVSFAWKCWLNRLSVYWKWRNSKPNQSFLNVSRR